jgi:putative oxidoreductase
VEGQGTFFSLLPCRSSVHTRRSNIQSLNLWPFASLCASLHSGQDFPCGKLRVAAIGEDKTMNMNRAVQITYFLLRVVAGLLIIQTGGLILFGWFGGTPGNPGAPSLLSQTGIGGVLEFFGGIAIVLGLGTRPVAFILSGMMAVAYWQFHAPHGRWPVQNQGMPAILFCFIFLYIAAQGAGDWSLDALLRRNRAAPPSEGSAS